MLTVLDKEYNFYKNNKETLDKKYDDKYIVIKDTIIIGIFDDHNTALTESLKNNKAGTFLIQKCSISNNQVRKFHSRVEFVRA